METLHKDNYTLEFDAVLHPGLRFLSHYYNSQISHYGRLVVVSGRLSHFFFFSNVSISAFYNQFLHMFLNFAVYDSMCTFAQ